MSYDDIFRYADILVKVDTFVKGDIFAQEYDTVNPCTKVGRTFTFISTKREHKKFKYLPPNVSTKAYPNNNFSQF